MVLKRKSKWKKKKKYIGGKLGKIQFKRQETVIVKPK